MSTPVDLQIREIIELDSALRSLVGHNEQGGQVRYLFDEKTKWNITKNLRVLKDEIEQYNERRIEKVKELSPVLGDVDKEKPETRAAFYSFNDSLLRTEVTVTGLLKLKRSSLLRPDQDGFPRNNIAEAVLVNLMPVIDDDGN